MLAATRRLCEEERVGRLIPLAKRSLPVGMGPSTRVMPVAIRIVPRRGSPPTRVMPLARRLFPVGEVLRRAPLRKASASRLTKQTLRVAANLLDFRPGLMAQSSKPGATPPVKTSPSRRTSRSWPPVRRDRVVEGVWGKSFPPMAHPSTYLHR